METSNTYEVYNYSANTSNVMNILINSIYTNKDIFLRELISNASDAINKAIVINPQYKLNNQIKITYDKDKYEFVIQDTGIGITKQDLISKIGSIGTSGTKQFINNLVENQTNSLIGQFGVGFYSVYLVSEHIQIVTKPINENKTYEWVSNSENSYSIRELEKYDDDEFIHGTKITLKLKPDALEYLEEEKLIEIIKTHSSYIEHPIMFEKHLSNGEKQFEKMNWLPLWAKPKSTISEQDYIDFYLHNIQDNIEQHIKDPPIHYSHFNVEGIVNFTGLLYIPEKAPFNLFEPSKRGQSLKLYTKNVLITATHTDLYPKWMEFIKGIVDTSDIELNVSRQTVQNTSKLRKIYNQLIKKTIEMIEELYANEEKYLRFYNQFSCSIKNGIHEEFSRDTSDNSDRNMGNNFGKRMLKLLKYHTSHGRFIGFDEYVKSMKPEQKAIYYIAGDKKEVLIESPFLDKLKTLDYEVLFFEEPIDEYMKGFLTEYKITGNDSGYIVGIHDQEFSRFKDPDMSDTNTKTFVDVSRDNLLIQSDSKDIGEEQGIELCTKLKELYKELGINFFEVKLNDKFTSVPAIIVNHVHLSAQLEKLLNNSANTKRNEQYKPVFERKDMLISNSNIVSQYFYKKLCVENIPINNPDIVSKAKYIYTCALIAGGYEPDNSNIFVTDAIKYLCLSF